MSDFEIKLISKMTDLKEISHVWSIGVSEEVFEEPIYRHVFGWMMKYFLDSHMQAAPTRLVMETQFPAIHLESLVEESTDWLVEHLRKRYLWGEIQDMGLDAVETGKEDPHGALARLWQRAYSAAQTAVPRASQVNMIESIEARQLRRARRRELDMGGAVTLGFPEVDAHTGGILPGELAIIAAYTKTGKSFMLAQATVAAHRAGDTPLLMTLEQSTAEMEDRIDAFYSGVSYSHIQENRITLQEQDQIDAANEEMRSSGHTIYIERPGRGERTIKYMVNRARHLGANYLLIDQLSFIDAEREYWGDRATTQKHGDLIFDLKDEIGNDSAGPIPCFLAVQLNRDTMRERSMGGRGALHNLANSSMIEQTADIALGLWRTSEMRHNHTMGLDIMGARRSDLKNWLLEWRLGTRTSFSVIEEMD